MSESSQSPSTDQPEAPEEGLSGRTVETPAGRLPLPPWWVILASLILIPAVVVGAMLWGAGWVIAQRWRSVEMEPPKDALFLMRAGRVCAQAVFWPALLYFSKTSQTKYALFKGALWAGRKGVRRVGSTATKLIRKGIGKDSG